MHSPFAIPGVVRASHLERPAPPRLSCGIAQVDELTGGGLPRGGLTEICGPASSGRTSLLMAVLAEATRRQELCALVDAADSFDPHTAAAAGVDLERLLWVRCGEHPPRRHRDTEAEKANHGSTRIYTDQKNQIHHRGTETQRENPDDQNSKFTNQNSNSGSLVDARDDKSKIENRKSKIPSVSPCLRGENGVGEKGVPRSPWFARLEQAIKATDLLLAGGGFSVVAIDLADVPSDVARRIPLASWFRFRRTVEHTPTVLLVLEREPHAKTCASLVLKTAALDEPLAHHQAMSRDRAPAHARLFRGLSVEVEVACSRMEAAKKPARNVGVFQSRAEWAG